MEQGMGLYNGWLAMTQAHRSGGQKGALALSSSTASSYDLGSSFPLFTFSLAGICRRPGLSSSAWSLFLGCLGEQRPRIGLLLCRCQAMGGDFSATAFPVFLMGIGRRP